MTTSTSTESRSSPAPRPTLQPSGDTVIVSSHSRRPGGVARGRSAAPVVAGVLATVAFLVTGVPPAGALHTESRPATRVTSGASHGHTAGRQWSTRALGFSSEVDLLANGSTGRQLFVFDLLAYDCNRFTTHLATPCPVPPRPPLLQLTHGPGSPDNPSLVFNTTIDNQLTIIVAFEADGSFNGGTGQAASHRQVYLMNITTGETIQVTNSPDGDSVHPSISANGSMVTFESTAPLAGVPGDAGVAQVFAYWRQWNLGIGHLMQITAGHAPSTAPSISSAKNSGLIVFESSADLLGDGHDTAASQIFLVNVDWVNEQIALTQLTNGNAPSRRPAFNAKQGFVAFESDATNLAGASSGQGTEIYAVPTTQGDLPPVKQITTFDPYGNCSFPAIGESGDRIAFICTGDPLHNDTAGNRAFVLEVTLPDITPGMLHQVTGRGDVKGPIGMYMGRSFLTIADNTDLTGEGSCDYQLYIVDFYSDDRRNVEYWHASVQPGDLPDDLTPPLPPPPPDSNLLGDHTFAVHAGTASSGSQLSLTTSNATTTVGITAGGQLRLEVGARDLQDGTATVGISTDSISKQITALPAVEVPGLGVLCARLTGAGMGVIDCDGGRANADLTLLEFHGNDPANPGCVGGCFESKTSRTCLGPHVGICRGPVQVTRSGSFIPGDMLLTLPAAIAISTYEGFDGVACSGDDTYTLNDVPVELNFTTGVLTATILGDGANPGSSITHTATGAPFDCSRLIGDDLGGAALVATFPVLDVPNVNGALKDLLITYRFEATSGVTYGVCDPDICSVDADCQVIDPAADAQTCWNQTCVIGALPCDDGNPCNGIATTDPLTGACIPGTPPNCDDGDPCTTDSCSPTAGCVHVNPCSDGDACNGIETCDPATGACGAGSPPNCDDGDLCTTDSCSAATGCVHTNTTGPCDDGTLCTVNDVCQDGVCRGSEQPCDDSDVCNGVEVCYPLTGVCQLGTPLIGQQLVGCELGRLDAILGTVADEIQHGPPVVFGGTSRQKRLLQRILMTQTKLRAAVSSTGTRLRAKLKAAKSRLSRFSGNIQKAILHGRIDAGSGTTLIALVSDMVEILDTLQQQVSPP